MMYFEKTSIPHHFPSPFPLKIQAIKPFSVCFTGILEKSGLGAVLDAKSTCYFLGNWQWTGFPFKIPSISPSDFPLLASHLAHIHKVFNKIYVHYISALKSNKNTSKRKRNSLVWSKGIAFPLFFRLLVSLNSLIKAIYHKPFSEIASYRVKLKI
ncbi:MAG: hypothetical protein O2809_00895 [Proteobacteria bacterium]|nr:hypothetical protein [Pseudomonadota bacterium]